MAKAEIINEWWLEPGQGDASLENEHVEFWQDVVEQVIDTSLTQKTVLDFGCNRGGLLKKLHEHYTLKKGVGVDIAQESIKVANSRVKNEPLEYLALTDISQFSEEFDIALSTAVIYLIQDIEDHARQVYNALKSGGVYYVTHPDYTQSTGGQVLMQEIQKFSATNVATNTLDDISNAFEGAGFQVSVKRMKPHGYVPHTSQSTWYRSVYDRLHHEYAERYAFKLVKL